MAVDASALPLHKPRPSSVGLATLLMLADGRLPVGAHANSGGVEWACQIDDVADPEVLESWMRARLATIGTIDAAFAAATVGQIEADHDLSILDSELSARMVGERSRLVSRQLGRQFARAAHRIWSHPTNGDVGTPDGPYAPIALGMTAAVLGVTPTEVAGVALHHNVASGGTAAVRLLGLDPLAVAAMQARLGEAVDTIAQDADVWAASDPADLPSRNSPLAEVLAEEHGTWSSRLFLA